LTSLTQNKSAQIIVISPHPDDETLGCGGTILKHSADGDTIHWLIVTSMSEKQGFSPQAIKQRHEEIESVAQMYGFETTHNLNFPTTRLDEMSLGDIINAISKVLLEIKPHTVYLPNRSDVHSDHKIVFHAAWSCCKTFRFPFIRRVLMYEIPSETDFAPALPETSFFPNIFSDISPHLERKIEIMREYKGELKEHPFPRSEHNIRSLATVRGATAGVEYAEAFTLLKEVF
jgi:LmbE family N-acetylglucosaminyl deacetylase